MSPVRRRWLRGLMLLVGVALAFLTAAGPAPAAGADCGSLASSSCGVTGQGDHFHGLIAVHSSPWLLAHAAHSGTQPGCGDCRWTIAIACPTESLGDPATQQACAAASDSPLCRAGELLYRVYLTTDTVLDRVEGTVCLGGADQVIDVGDRAEADVARYLRNVTPPDLLLQTKPASATLAGLSTYFDVRPPGRLAPVPFGGGGITELIRITPARVAWRYDDRAGSVWLPPDRTVHHVYGRGGLAHGRLTVRWDATYTITYAGDRFGPFDAAGGITKVQRFTLPVRTSSPVLVSH